MAVTVTKEKIAVEDINWYDGTATFSRTTSTGGAQTVNKVSAADIPIEDVGAKITAINVEGALEENRDDINTNTTLIEASHDSTAGRHVLARAAKTADYAMVAGDETISVDATADNVDITLPTATAGKIISVMRTDATYANHCKLVGTVDGYTNFFLWFQYEAVVLEGDGTNWKILSWRKPSYVNVGDNSHGGDTNETSLVSFTIAATAMGSTGAFEFFAAGNRTGANADSTVRIRFGSGLSGTILYALPVLHAGTEEWYIRGELYGVTSATQRSMSIGRCLGDSAALPDPNYVAGTEDTAAADMLLTVSTENGHNDDTIVCRMFKITRIK